VRTASLASSLVDATRPQVLRICAFAAHIDLEGLVLVREVRALRDQFVTFNYAKLLYNGLDFSPEREFLEESIIASQRTV
jgi:argininosuccinate synthase